MACHYAGIQCPNKNSLISKCQRRHINQAAAIAFVQTNFVQVSIMNLEYLRDIVERILPLQGDL